MAYHLSAAKLQTYHRCAQSYYFRYERGIKTAAFFGSASLGTALHEALAQIYRDWHYQDPIPGLDWVEYCWSQHTQGLSPTQVTDGQVMLQRYHERFMASQTAIARPVAVEGKIQGSLQVENLEFTLAGRYDRLDYLADGLELIDYKSNKDTKLLDPAEMNLQIGLYYLALEQTYPQTLRRLSLIYLRTGENISFEVTPEHRQRVESAIGDLALRLRTDAAWEPTTGGHCDRCTYARYCPGVQAEPEPLPMDAKPRPELQLALSLALDSAS
ncbi:PD-(D/E)XK nuclease family protein [Trichocoleus sp. FACHB-591]|uniref:RecB family exonuclease n=1 Tax=Trichocoleus sp. FACHB-591 TaxID=2692872 RepID=UPI001686B761|nr:PD-(D/E)XK nuclease family protein [Trichocoleus sp. FACHB-591]MBD2093688.1 PD-(D/E)XK nuclease family protein [Trichocoleus sp. FACHB-591]